MNLWNKGEKNLQGTFTAVIFNYQVSILLLQDMYELLSNNLGLYSSYYLTTGYIICYYRVQYDGDEVMTSAAHE